MFCPDFSACPHVACGRAVEGLSGSPGPQQSCWEACPAGQQALGSVSRAGSHPWEWTVACCLGPATGRGHLPPTGPQRPACVCSWVPVFTPNRGGGALGPADLALGTWRAGGREAGCLGCLVSGQGKQDTAVG